MLPDLVKEQPLAAAVENRFSAHVIDGAWERGELALTVDPAQLVTVCEYLKSQQGFNRLSSITALDWYPQEPRFETVYHLHSLNLNARVRLKCKVAEGQPIDSLTGVWRAANWYEREVFDLFGISFTGHPDLTRIMMPADWEGHPLRKDYPVHGYKYSYQDEN